MEISKRQLRERVLGLINQQTKDEQQSKSLIIQKKLFDLPEFKEAKTILFYASCPGEVQTLDMIRSARKLGKIIGLPKICKDRKAFLPVIIDSLDTDISEGAYGIPEPVRAEPVMELDNLDMVVVPAVAFDRCNNRLGRGGGFYDRFLSDVPPSVCSIGLAYDVQLVDHIPGLQGHDIPVSKVLSN